MSKIIVTGCERSGTTVIAKNIAQEKGLPFVHETYTHEKAVIKHSLNMNQNIKHLELLDHLYPDAEWVYVIRDGREVCRSIHQKIWQRQPTTMSLDQAIEQWNFVNDTCWGFVRQRHIVGMWYRYEETVDEPVMEWQDYFTYDQKQYLNNHLNLERYGYE